jgi:hypothetical protein
MPIRGTSDGTYPPLDALKPVAKDIWIVDSGPLRVFGAPLPVRMTVVRLASGDLWLHSPTRFDAGLCDRLQREGPIAHIVAPNVAHWMFLRDWHTACPNARTYAAPGLRKRRPVRKAKIRIDADLSEMPPAAWEDELEHTIVRGIGFAEVDFFHRASRTLIMTDLVQNLEPDRLPAAARWLARLVGSAAPDGGAPFYLRLAVRAKGRSAADAAARLVALEPERVIFSHGLWFEDRGAEKLRRSLRWLVSAGEAAAR